jgi:hypothetical protein
MDRQRSRIFRERIKQQQFRSRNHLCTPGHLCRLSHRVKNQPLGDSVGYAEAAGLTTDQVVLRAAIPAVLDAWRLFGDDVPKWVPALSIAAKGIGITAIWVN